MVDTIATHRYHACCVIGYVEWLHADIKGSVSPSIKGGEHIIDKEARAQVLYRRFKRKTHDSEIRHRKQLEDHAKEPEEKDKEIERWRFQALSLKQSMLELSEEFRRQREECINKGFEVGGNLAKAYLVTRHNHFENAI